VTRDVELDGVRVPAGEKILLLFGAANRDPRRWSRPDRFDITRRSGGHLAFGVGLHACVGRVVAYLEGEVMLKALVRFASAMEMTREPRWHLSNTIRGLAELPLRLTPAPGRHPHHSGSHAQNRGHHGSS
jgi:cytochrome P450